MLSGTMKPGSGSENLRLAVHLIIDYCRGADRQSAVPTMHAAVPLASRKVQRCPPDLPAYAVVDPFDNQGVRFLLDPVRAKEAWRDDL